MNQIEKNRTLEARSSQNGVSVNSIFLYLEHKYRYYIAIVYKKTDDLP